MGIMQGILEEPSKVGRSVSYREWLRHFGIHWQSARILLVDTD